MSENNTIRKQKNSYLNKAKGTLDKVAGKKVSFTITGTEYTGIETLYSFKEIVKKIIIIILNSDCFPENITICTTGKTLIDFAAMFCARRQGCRLNIYLGANFNFNLRRFDENEFDSNSETYCKGIGCVYNEKYEQFQQIIPNVFNLLYDILNYKYTRTFVVKEYNNVKKLLCKSDNLIIFKEDNDKNFDELKSYFDISV